MKTLKECKKVLFFVDGFKGGAGNVVQILAKKLYDRKYDVTICCVGGTTEGRHNISGVKVFGIKSIYPYRLKYIQYIFEMKNKICEIHPDVVISFLFGVSAFAGAAIKKKRDYIFITSERSDPTALKPKGILQKMVRSAYKKADAIVVLFDAFKNLENGIFVEKCITIPNPIPVINNEKVLNEEYIRFVTIANEGYAKGLDLLIKVFAEVVKKYPKVQLDIYGSIKSDLIRNMIKEFGLEQNVNLAGYTQQVEKVLENASVYIMPSRNEGFPNALCEAMSAGKACVAFECHDGINELIQSRVNGIVVPKENINKMAEEIIKLIENPSLIIEYGMNAKMVANKYSVEHVVDMWEELFLHMTKK